MQGSITSDKLICTADDMEECPGKYLKEIQF